MTLEQSQPLRAPQTDPEWNALFLSLSELTPLPPAHEVAVKYEAQLNGWRAPNIAEEMEALEGLRERFIYCVKELHRRVTALAATDSKESSLPQLVACIARADYFRVRQTSEGNEYALLAELRDKDGKSLLLCNDFISVPNPHTYGILIRKVVKDAETSFEYQTIYSSSSFVHEINSIEETLKQDGMRTLTGRVQFPLLLQIVNRAAQEFNLHGIEKIRISHIDRVPNFNSKEGIYLLHTDMGLCSVRLLFEDGMLLPKAHAKLVR